MAGVVAAAGLQHRDGAERVDVEGTARGGERPRHGAQAGQVHDRVDAGEGVVQRGVVEDRPGDLTRVEADQPGSGAGGEVVEDDDLVPALARGRGSGARR